MEVSVDINEVEKFITNEKFTNFLLENTADFGVAAFIMQSLLDAVEEAKESMKET
jgi:hypothetical protein